MELIAQDKKVKRGKLTFILVARHRAGVRRARCRSRAGARVPGARHCPDELRPTPMNATVINLLLAVFLLAANAFYVAAEFALVKAAASASTRWRRRTASAHALCRGSMAKSEAYLACCQLGITMASLGLGWVGEPTVAALLTPILMPLGMSEAALHFTSFLVGFLVFSSLHIVVGEQVPKTLAIRKPEPVSLWVAYPLHVILRAVLSAELAAQCLVARHPQGARHRGIPSARNPDRRGDRRAGRGVRRARQDGDRAGGVHPQRLPLQRPRSLATSWFTAPRW